MIPSLLQGELTLCLFNIAIMTIHLAIPPLPRIAPRFNLARTPPPRTLVSTSLQRMTSPSSHWLGPLVDIPILLSLLLQDENGPLMKTEDVFDDEIPKLVSQSASLLLSLGIHSFHLHLRQSYVIPSTRDVQSNADLLCLASYGYSYPFNSTSNRTTSYVHPKSR